MATSPVNSPVTQAYGVNCGYYSQFNLKLRNGTSCHEGWDYAAPYGTPVRAAHSGTVRYRGALGNYGNYVGLQHDSGYGTGYSHLSSFNVSNGQRVNEGDVIGYVGSTGNSTGPHLHFNYYRQYGTWVYDNPNELFGVQSEQMDAAAKTAYENRIKELEADVKRVTELFNQSNYKLAEREYLWRGIKPTDAQRREWITVHPVDTIVNGITQKTGIPLTAPNAAQQKLSDIEALIHKEN